MEAEGPNAARVSVGEFILDRDDERLIGAHGPVRLGNKAYRIFEALVGNRGRLLTKDSIFSTVWDGTIVSESALTSVIKELRRALGDDPKAPRYIESVYGRGYRLVAPIGTAASEPRREAGAPAPPPAASGGPPLILVAGFNDEAIRERMPHCAAAIREEIISGLSRFREIQLVAQDEGSDPPRSADGEARGYQLTATFLPSGDDVKVIARAKRMRDGRVIWAETMALGDTGAARGVEQIVRRIVGSAFPAVDDDLFDALPQASNSFYDRYLIAKRRSLAASSFAEASAAARELEALVAERPDFALAYPPLVRLYNIDFGYTALGSSDSGTRDRALALAKAGLAADRGHVHAYTVLGFCHLYHGQFGEAARCFEQALERNPYNPVRLNEVATGMIYLGEFDRARDLLDLSLRLQQFASDNHHEDLGWLNLLTGEPEAACRAFAAMASPSIWSELYLALCEPDERRRIASAAAWRARIERGWHDDAPPSTERIAQWIRDHHPFKGDSGRLFFERAERLLSVADSPATAQ